MGKFDIYNCDDCRFHVCTKKDEIPKRHECAPSLHFNRLIGVCDYPHNANCPINEVSLGDIVFFFKLEIN